MPPHQLRKVPLLRSCVAQVRDDMVFKTIKEDAQALNRHSMGDAGSAAFFFVSCCPELAS